MYTYNIFFIIMFCLNFSREEYNDDLAKETPWNQLSNKNIYFYNTEEKTYNDELV